MAPCDFRSRLNAYHDGELTAEEMELFERHVQSCGDCAAELAEIRRLSSLFDDFASRPVEEPAVSRIHEAVDALDQTESGTLRIAGVLTALAASVLVVASVWLMEAPAAENERKQVVRIEAPAPEWERVASTLRADAMPGGGPGIGPAREPALADADLANWMLRNLDDKVTHGSN